MFQQIGKDFRLDVNEKYHLKANSIKQNSNTIEIIALNGISLKCGGNALTVNQSGIHLHSNLVDTTSSNSGVNVQSVIKPNIEKPLYEKIRVVKIETNIVKQNSIEDMLTFTAIVEKYENDSWNVSTDLNETQLSQMQWYFVKNNDENDKDINVDRIINDTINKNGLIMSVKLQSDNVDKYAHAHCFVIDSENEGYAQIELKRDVQIINVQTKYVSQEEGELKAILNIEEPRVDEIEQIRWMVENKDVLKYNGKQIIKHNLKDEKVNEINFKAYINGKIEKSVNAMMVFDENSSRLTNMGAD